MAIGKKTGGKNFEHGNKANPNGRPRVPEEIRRARDLNKVAFARVLNDFIHMTKDAVLERVKRPEASALEILIGSIIVKAAATGDHQRFNFLLDRMIGKVKDEVEHSLPKPLIIRRRNGEEIILGTTADKEEKEEG